jgi:glycine/D-amino acid oxidase-like deaminating enzyme
MIQGAMWDPDAGLVKPRSQTVVGVLVDEAVKTGKAQSWANTTATGLDIQDGRIVGVETSRGYIAADTVVVCTGLWGRSIAEMAGEDLPVMPVDHPLSFFAPFDEFAGTGTRARPRAGRSNGDITKKRNRAWCIRATCRQKAKPTGRRRNATSNWNKSWSRWSAPWN